LQFPPDEQSPLCVQFCELIDQPKYRYHNKNLAKSCERQGSKGKKLLLPGHSSQNKAKTSRFKPPFALQRNCPSACPEHQQIGPAKTKSGSVETGITAEIAY
jgi:hypothetical protein